MNNPRTVYVEGLPFDSSEDDVRTFFDSVGGRIKSVRLPRWHDSGRLRGYGHVEFESIAQAEKAIELNGTPHFLANLLHQSRLYFRKLFGQTLYQGR